MYTVCCVWQWCPFTIMAIIPVILLTLTAFHPAMSNLNSYGTDFILAFPENIAFYHPSKPLNQLKITAMGGNGTVNINVQSVYQTMIMLNKGQMVVVDIPVWFEQLELDRSNISGKVLHVTSDGVITVQAISRRAESIQTTPIPPTRILGNMYHIPAMWHQAPWGPGTTDSDTSPPNGRLLNITSIEEVFFRLLVINTENVNEVTVWEEEKNKISVTLKPFQLLQRWINISQPGLRVSAEHPVAVLLSHPCAFFSYCNCIMLVTYLTPTQLWGSNFIMPAFMGNNPENNTLLLVSTREDEDLPDGQVGDQLSSVLEIDSTNPISLILKTSNMLLNLMPLQSFSSCFLLHTLPTAENKALVMALTDEKDGVHLGTQPLTADWKPMKDTSHSWALVELDARRDVTVIWHVSSRIAVYYVGREGTAVFASPALSLSKHLDPNGCLLRPEVLMVGEEEAGWPETLTYCRNQKMEQISFSTENFLKHVIKELKSRKQTVETEVWIGLRRSSLNGRWYWYDQAALNVTHWAANEPGLPGEGQCAAMNLDDYRWSDQSCCKALPALCYRKPVYFPLT